MRWSERTSRLVLLTALAAATLAAPIAAAPAIGTRPQDRFDLTGRLVQGGHAIGRVPPGTLELDFAGQPVRIDPEGRFIIGFGREAPPIGWLEARDHDGRPTRQAIAIGRRAFAVEDLPGLRAYASPVPPSAEVAAKRRVERANIRAARFGNSAAPHWAERFRWPVLGRLSGEYGSQRRIDGKPVSTHYGVDIAAPAGTPVAAPATGRVKLAAANYSLEGGIVIIDHGHGLMSTFLHLSHVDVRTGATLKAGDRMGAVGSTGRSTGPHLHWAMHWGRTRIDPALFVEPMPKAVSSAADPGSPSERGAVPAGLRR